MYRLGCPRSQRLLVTFRVVPSTAAYSTQQRQHPNMTVYVEKRDDKRQNTLFAPLKDFPFNGNVAAADVYLGKLKKEEPKKEVKTTNPSTSGDMKRTTIVDLVKKFTAPTERSPGYSPAESVKDFTFCFDDEVLTIESVECPRLLKDELRKVFEPRSPHLFSHPITVINIFQQEAQTFEEVTSEEKLDAKLVYFVETADSICDSLNRMGYWADYLDPHSGQARRDPAGAAERMLKPNPEHQKVGFNLEDLKKCIRISNVSFDSQHYIGSIFTNAKVDEANMADFFDVLNGDEDDFRQK
ncbi:unnamed protein product [Bursaphelenchus xylophilus]|nr:unnamed protein product [Bursaphelenchus xylophilus]CAG9104025.1 unnamed protein product [Bursaphelenchus xylophilus]